MKLSFAQLKSIVATYVAENKVSTATFNVTRDNTALLVDKIAKVFTLDTSFADKLAVFEGEELSLGKTLEEWQQDLMLPEAYDENGAGALSPHKPTYRPAFYSYTLGRKKIPTTIYNNDIERAVNNPEELASVVSMKTKRLYDSYTAWRYEVKREIVAKFIAMCEAEQGTATSYTGETFNTGGEYAVNSLVRSASTSGAKYGIIVKPYDSEEGSWAEAVASGYIIELDLVTSIAVPTDTATGEAFILQVKKDVEVAKDMSEGRSLNGNTLGATDGLVLLVKQGVIPTLEVETLAGAFNADKLAFPVEVITIKDFGSNTSAFAMLVDRRGIKLHNTYKAVREQANGDGDFMNLFLHTEDTAYISRNVFVKVYKAQ